MEETTIPVLPYSLNLDPLSILRLSSFFLCVSISVFLLKVKNGSKATRLLGFAFAGASLFNLSMVAEYSGSYYWQPQNVKNVIVPFMQCIGALTAMTSLLSFSYKYPRRGTRIRKIYRNSMIVALVLDVAACVFCYFSFVVYREQLEVRQAYFFSIYLIAALQLLFSLALLYRKSLPSGPITPGSFFEKSDQWSRRACRALTKTFFLILFAIVVLLVSILGGISPLFASYVLWFVFMAFYSVFVVSYINHTRDTISIQIKLVGGTMVAVLCIMSIVAILIGQTVVESYTARELPESGTSVLFERKTSGGYTVSTEPFQFEEELGDKIEIPYGGFWAGQLPFSFPFFDAGYRNIHISSSPMVLFGKNNLGGWGGVPSAAGDLSNSHGPGSQPWRRHFSEKGKKSNCHYLE